MSSMARTFRRLTTEQKVHLTALVIAGLSAATTVLFESQARQAAANDRSLGDGWRLLSHRQDIADFEWIFWFSNLRESILFAIAGHVIISCLSAWYLPWAREGLVASFCVYMVQMAVGGSITALIFLICIVFYTLSSIASQSKSLNWASTIIIVLIMHFDGFYMEIIPDMPGLSPSMQPIAYSAVGFTVLRCSSFWFERARDGRSHPEKFYFSQLVMYNFYLPYFFFGPVMTYDAFVGQEENSPSVAGIKTFFRGSIKILLSVITIDFLLHFVHISSIAIDSEYLESASVHVLGFLLFCNVFLDWMKAYVLYTITSTVAKVVDGYTGAPEAPKCIATICTFADTYFDRGIQHWVSRYVYDPLAEGHRKISKETFASAVTFLFVATWQGPGLQVIIWAILNCLGLTFEYFISAMTPAQDKAKKRFVAVFLGLNYWLILLFNTAGINGLQTARISGKSLFFSGSIWNFTSAVLLGYCYAGFLTLSSPVKKKLD